MGGQERDENGQESEHRSEADDCRRHPDRLLFAGHALQQALKSFGAGERLACRRFSSAGGIQHHENALFQNAGFLSRTEQGHGVQFSDQKRVRMQPRGDRPSFFMGPVGIDGGFRPCPWMVEVRTEGRRSAVARFFRPGHRRIGARRTGGAVFRTVELGPADRADAFLRPGQRVHDHRASGRAADRTRRPHAAAGPPAQEFSRRHSIAERPGRQRSPLADGTAPHQPQRQPRPPSRPSSFPIVCSRAWALPARPPTASAPCRLA